MLTSLWCFVRAEHCSDVIGAAIQLSVCLNLVRSSAD